MLTQFLEKAEQGFDVVYAVRQKRKEGPLKKLAYWGFYRVLERMAGITIPKDSGDFCLMSRRAADIINQMPEKNRFMRGMRSWIGFKQAPLLYERQERKAGISKYNLRKLLRLAADGIFNFSDLPVRLITMAGLGVMTIAGAYLLYALVQKWVYGISPQGFTGLLAVIVLLSGVQLLSLGIIGEYVLRIFFQTKDRPFYVVEQVVRRQTHT